VFSGSCPHFALQRLLHAGAAGHGGTMYLRPLTITDATGVWRRLPLASGRNFRDLGGIAVCGGRMLASGRLIRSDDMNSLCSSDLDMLAAIPLVSVIDFRAVGEAARRPDKLPSSVRHHLHFPIVPGKLETWAPDEGLRSKGGHGFMTDMYRSLVLDENCIEAYREFFRYLQYEDGLPLLFHCSAGKDRTGMAAAFILLSLGVDRESIMQDYMDSNICLAGKYDHVIAGHPGRAAIFFAERGYLQAAVAAMEEMSGSVEQYLAGVLGVEAERMRARFLL
jgi:protein-tyrosine phosphatase